MEYCKDFKYFTEIEELQKKGIDLPNLQTPNQKEAYRWCFDYEHKNNHLPVYKQQPLRLIKDNEKDTLTTSGFALSCYETKELSIEKYKKVLKINKNFSKIAGNSVSFVLLKNNDGKITDSNNEKHFDLYEYVNFEPNKEFKIIEKL